MDNLCEGRISPVQDRRRPFAARPQHEYVFAGSVGGNEDVRLARDQPASFYVTPDARARQPGREEQKARRFRDRRRRLERVRNMGEVEQSLWTLKVRGGRHTATCERYAEQRRPLEVLGEERLEERGVGRVG